MKDINNCPSTLMEGFKTYSPKAVKSLWDGKKVNHILDKYMRVPDETVRLVNSSFLNDKMKRYYLRIINERTSRFIRTSE